MRERERERERERGRERERERALETKNYARLRPPFTLQGLLAKGILGVGLLRVY